MPTRKIADPPKFCTHPDHEPPSMRVFSPGTYEHTCSGCGAKRIFTVPGVYASYPGWHLEGRGPVTRFAGSTRNVVESAIDAQKDRQPYRVTRNLSTPETRAFWAHVKKKAALVATWPAWKRDGVILPSST